MYIKVLIFKFLAASSHFLLFILSEHLFNGTRGWFLPSNIIIIIHQSDDYEVCINRPLYTSFYIKRVIHFLLLSLLLYLIHKSPYNLFAILWERMFCNYNYYYTLLCNNTHTKIKHNLYYMPKIFHIKKLKYQKSNISFKIYNI